MALDVVEVDRLGNTIVSVNAFQICLEMRVVADPLPVAFEMAVVDRIEAHECAEQTVIGLHDARTEQVFAAIGEALFQTLERIEQFRERFLVGGLRVREARFVDTIVDVVINALAQRCLLVFDVFREKIDRMPRPAA